MIMRYIKVGYGNGYCGCDGEEYLHTDMSDKELDNYAQEQAMNNAESYQYMVWGWDYNTAEEYAEENDVSVEEAEEMMEYYWENIESYWEEITQEEYEDNVC